MYLLQEGRVKMAISINTHFHPFRLVMRNKEPVQLGIELVNKENDIKKLTLEVSLTRQLAFDKSGLKNFAVERIDALEPNQSKQYYFDLYPKQLTQAGEQDIVINVTEHHHDYKHVMNENRREIALTVVD